MPEYLAPGVYVEEVSMGTKPIEGVSTSTAGMVGVTERGPLDIPTLVTSFGEFTRIFGGRLNIRDFSNDGDAHCYLPHAVEGFFSNGGKRLYVTRVLPDGAQRAQLRLFARGEAGADETLLLRPAGELTGTAASPPLVLVLDGTGMEDENWVRVGDGSHAEYRQLAADPEADDSLIPLGLPLGLSHDADEAIWEFINTPDTGVGNTFTAGFTIAAATVAGSRRIELVPTAASPNDVTDVAALAEGQLLEIGSAGQTEHRLVEALDTVSPTRMRVTLESPLTLSREATTAVTPLVIPGVVGDADDNSTLERGAEAGAALLFVPDRDGSFVTQGNLVVVDPEGDNAEVRSIGDLGQLTLATGAYGDYPAGSRLEAVTLTDDDRALDGAVLAGDTDIELDDAEHLESGDQLVLDPTLAGEETVTIRRVDGTTVYLTEGLDSNHADDADIRPVAKRTTAAAASGAHILALDNRLGLEVDDLIRVGEAPNDEYHTIAAIPSPSPAAPNAGILVLDQPLGRAHALSTPVRRQHEPTLDTGARTTVPAQEVDQDDTRLLVADGTGYAMDDGIRVTTPAGEETYHRASSVDTALTPDLLTLDRALERSHTAGSAMVASSALIRVQALDPGAWGDRLRISVEDEETGLVSETTIQNVIGPPPYTTIRLASAAGVEPGTVLEILDPADESVIGVPVKVDDLDRSGDLTLTLAGTGLSAAQAVVGNLVRSRELRIRVRLLRQPDLAVPSRNSQVIDSELFEHLSMDPRHTRYLHRVIGTTWGTTPGEDDDGNPLRLEDRRSQGGSGYVRVRDLAASAAEARGVRLGPETLTDTQPDGSTRPARHALDGGVDGVDLPGVTDDFYIGDDDRIPENRTGLYTLTAVDDISIIACPGRTGSEIHAELIGQCERMRYRFAVLDGPVPPNDSLNDVQRHRQRFDTKYAALYYPWLRIRDPFPANLDEIAFYPIPPAGHLMGIYARTDIERGVHKAPANTVVRGILGLTRTLNKGEHDLLNPSPVNINVIRDFRRDNRGIRVWGARVITSDTEYKYVNVRRLLIYLEKSIDRGLQWVVFEPNAEPLWAKVRRAISNFLTTTWRSGALEGTKPEDAFFVKCDRTTMTQTDIDNGRLICVVGVAAVKPAEYVIVRIGLWTAHGED